MFNVVLDKMVVIKIQFTILKSDKRNIHQVYNLSQRYSHI